MIVVGIKVECSEWFSLLFLRVTKEHVNEENKQQGRFESSQYHRHTTAITRTTEVESGT